jgi:hypothetical protein
LASEAAYIDSKAEPVSDHQDDNSSEVEGEAAHVNLVSAKLDEEPWGNRARTEFNESITADAYERAFIGVHSFSAYMRAEYDDMNMQLSGGSEGFGGIVMDTACTGASVCSEREYRRYCRDTGVEYKILPNSSAWVAFGDANKVTGQGRLRSLGIAIIKGYLPDLDTVFEFDAHIMSGVDTPLLMSLNAMDALGMDLRTRNSEFHINGRGQKLTRDEKNRLVLKSGG